MGDRVPSEAPLPPDEDLLPHEAPDRPRAASLDRRAPLLVWSLWHPTGESPVRPGGSWTGSLAVLRWSRFAWIVSLNLAVLIWIVHRMKPATAGRRLVRPAASHRRSTRWPCLLRDRAASMLQRSWPRRLAGASGAVSRICPLRAHPRRASRVGHPEAPPCRCLLLECRRRHWPCIVRRVLGAPA